MFLSAVIILVCSGLQEHKDKVMGKPSLCDEIHHIRMITAEDIRGWLPYTEKYTDLQLCNVGWQIAAMEDGSSALGENEYVRVICHIGTPDSKPETPK